ncbi:PEP-CTERM sorting domain-containing protein [Gemmata sp.]|uniref:PEP-CTERM sorting domain-containing protein n=1 Tax=Gemmata sp. TaxID=1914242 RepID=UPI003F6E75C2
MTHKWMAAVVATVALALAPSEAAAGLIPYNPTVTPEGGMYRYSYAIQLPTDSVLRPGDYFTIYNFDGYVAGSAMASGSAYSSDWTFSTSNVGPTPSGILPADDPSIPNLTWTYTGAEINVDAQVGLGNFWAVSLYPTTTDSWFAASTGSSTGATDNNIIPTEVPVPSAAPPGVPEPATLLLAGLGLPLAAGFRRWKAGATR